MSRRDLSPTVALCTSLLVHGVLALLTFEGARRQQSAIHLPGFRGAAPDVIEVDSLDALRLGGTLASGLAPNASPGEESTRAKDAPGDQALLSRDPQGPGSVGDPPAWSLMPATETSAVDATLPSAMASQSVPVLPLNTEVARAFGAGPAAAELVGPRFRRSSPLPAAPRSERAQASSNKPAADPAIMSPAESDAFSMLGGIEFRDGRMESRLGRAFKSVRPRLSFAAQLDLMSISEPRIVLKISIDASGKVTSVDVVRSTGSTLIDQPVKVSMYEWWFEPPTTADGRQRAETFVLPISWH